MELLTEKTAPEYLRAQGIIGSDDEAQVEMLGGGISNVVLAIETPGRSLVLKQAMPKLRVEADWPSDVRRALREADCMVALRELIGAEHVPALVHADEERYVIVMTRAPKDMTVWKADLMAGKVNPGTARRVGELLRAIQQGSRGRADLRERFGDKTCFYQLRVSPYHEATGARHPDLQPYLERVRSELMGAEEVLVHGDYSPKNILVRDDEIVLLDHEVVHYGHPAFDPAFCLNHLLLKSIKFAPNRSAYLDAARAFLKGYGEDIPGLSFHLGWLMLARMDGKSPVEYITTEEARAPIRAVARKLIAESPPIDAALEYVVSAG